MIHPIMQSQEFTAFKKQLERGEKLSNTESAKRSGFKGEYIVLEGSPFDPTLVLKNEQDQIAKSIHPAFFGMIDFFKKYQTGIWQNV